MSSQGRVRFSILIVSLFSLLTAPNGTTWASDTRYDGVITAAAAEPEGEAKSWNPLITAKRAAGKVAGAVASSARKITKGITGTITGLFGGNDGPALKQASGGAAKETGATAIEEQKPAAVQAEGKDQLNGQQETHGTLAAKPERAMIAQPDPGASPDIETKELASLTKAESPSTTPNVRCEKAKLTVSNYAFAEIETINCTGEVYRFSATREGDKFLVKVRALNGELLEVEKLKPSSGPVAAKHPKAP